MAELLFPLGARVKDTISDVEGFVIARTEWLYGCARYTVQPEGMSNGKPVDPFTLDEPQLIAVEGRSLIPTQMAVIPEPEPMRRHGGREDAGRAPDPTR